MEKETKMGVKRGNQEEEKQRENRDRARERKMEQQQKGETGRREQGGWERERWGEREIDM